MSTNERKRLYVKFRANGGTPIGSWYCAGIVERFRANECGEHDAPQIGDMRIRLEPDNEPYDPGDTLEPFRGSDGRWRSREELERELNRILDSQGVWGVIGEVWDGSDWEHADSCWGYAGFDRPDCPIENFSIVDTMASCLALRAKLGENVAALP